MRGNRVGKDKNSDSESNAKELVVKWSNTLIVSSINIHIKVSKGSIKGNLNLIF